MGAGVFRVMPCVVAGRMIIVYDANRLYEKFAVGCAGCTGPESRAVATESRSFILRIFEKEDEGWMMTKNSTTY